MRFWTHTKAQTPSIPNAAQVADDASVRPTRPAPDQQDQIVTASRPKPRDLPPEHGELSTPAVMRKSIRPPSDSDVLASVLEQTRSIETAAPKPAAPAQPDPDTSVDWTLPGFDRRCRVSTNFGEMPIEALRRRDMVKTISGAYRMVRWIDAIRLDADFMARHPQAHPVQLRAKALGSGHPVRNILVSPAQIIHPTGLVGNKKRARASEFEGYPSIDRLPQPEMTYYRFHCGQEEVVCVEGAWFCVAP